MQVEIEYCGVWNYLPEATRAAAELKEALSVDTQLIAGKDGIFDVKVDGRLVFSKDKEYRFPEDGELVKLLSDS